MSSVREGSGSRRHEAAQGQAAPQLGGLLSGLAPFDDTPAICSNIKQRLSGLSSTTPDGVVELTKQLPHLLEATAAYSAAFPPDSSNGSTLISTTTTSTATSSRGGSSGSGVNHTAVASALARSSYSRWLGCIDAFNQLFTALNLLNRLPHQQVMDYISSAAAAAHVGWMEDLAGRTLQQLAVSVSSGNGATSTRSSSGRSGSISSTRGSSGRGVTTRGISQASALESPRWSEVAGNLLHLSCLMQELRNQCVMATHTAAAAAAGAHPGAGDPAGGSSSSVGAGDGGGHQGSAQLAAAPSRAAVLGGSTHVWESMGQGPAGHLLLETVLQSRAAWLGPNMVRLARAWLHQVPDGTPALTIIAMARHWVAMQLDFRVHPLVVQLGLSSRTETAAVATLKNPIPYLQEAAWDFLATGSQALRELVLPVVQQRWSLLLHPTLRRCPRYHRGLSYGAGVIGQFKEDELDLLRRWGGGCDQQLVAAELWDLWPWQLEMLQKLEQLEQQQQGTGTPHQTIREGVQHGGQHGARSNSSSSNSAAPSSCSSSATTVTRATNSNAFSSSSASTNCCGCDDIALAVERHVLLPLLPSTLQMLLLARGSSQWQAPPTCQLPPVTQQQLQLALERVCLTVELSPQDARSSIMLLVLLLLRAELPQRLAFLQGPWGGLLLAALQQYGRGRTPLHVGVNAVVPGLAPSSGMGMRLSRKLGVQGLLDSQKDDVSSRVIVTADSVSMMLMWLLLQPLDGAGAPCALAGSSGSSRSGGSSSFSSGSICCHARRDRNKTCTAAWTVVHTEYDGAGGVPCYKAAGADVQLLSGYVPGLQLVATLETLWHMREAAPGIFTSALAATFEADPSRAPPPGSPVWLVLASTAVAIRKKAISSTAASMPMPERSTAFCTCSGALLPLLRLATVAQQQPGRGWGALVLGSAVQGAVLACCTAALDMAEEPIVAISGGPKLAVVLHLMQQAKQQQQQLSRKQAVLHAAAHLTTTCGSIASGIAPPGRLVAGSAPPPVPLEAVRTPAYMYLVNCHRLLTALAGSWPGAAAAGRPSAHPSTTPRPSSPAAAAIYAQFASLPADAADPVRAALKDMACVVEVCNVASLCARACGEPVQLLGCAYLGCTTQPPSGMSSCEATLVVNRKGSVCGGCGVVRYCGAACAQKDWAGHRRVCRKLAAAAVAAQQKGGG